MGSSASIAWPNTVLNAIVAESLDFVATELEKRAGKKLSAAKLETAVKGLLKEIVKKHRRVVFDGDNYSAEWHREAERRGLPHLRSAPDALPVLGSRKSQALFQKYGILNKRELEARVDVNLERYNRVVGIEARTLISMLKREVMPAAVRFQAELGSAVSATLGAGVKCPDARAELEQIVDLVGQLRRAIDAVEKAERHTADNGEKHARHVRDKLVPAMVRAREISDTLEELIPDDLWPLPRYSEMLFVK